MEDFVKIECDISSTDPTSLLELEIWIDSNKILDSTVGQTINFSHQLLDDEGNHELKFVLKNKGDKHTVIDEAGNIIKDSCLEINNIKFDGIELGHTFFELSNYHHNYNGSKDWVNEQFFGTMGCNGTVSLKFDTPIYLWLLENM